MTGVCIAGLVIYNSEKYLEECLLSISQQTFTDFEIWAINDGSTSCSLEILKKHQEKEPRLHILSQENKGFLAARNLGLENATGEYITFVDADDTIKNDYLSQLISVFLLDKSVDLTVCGFLGSETRVFKEISFIINEENIENVISLFDKYLLFPPYCKLYKRAIIAENGIKFNETINFSEDHSIIEGSCAILKYIGIFSLKAENIQRFLRTGSSQLRKNVASI